MRRKISLYIADKRVDLDDQELILFNYLAEELTNPTIVKNSYSHQVTLKGTPENNKIFGDAFRLDRVVGYSGNQTGTDFNPARKTPFTIYNERNEVLESGYCKLDSVNREKREQEYKISLFGGLGAFLYSLSYDAEGSKRTLASLDYLGTGNTEAELDFTINAESVATAWESDTATGEIDNIWKVINFAPAYNGIPDGNFAPDKAVVVPSSVGLQDTIGNYHLRGGYARVNLAEKYDEWAVKDLRSYLQRPVFSIRALLHAVSKPENNGGYSVNMPFLDKYDFNWVRNLWMTLPMIPSLGTFKQEGGDLSLELETGTGSAHEVARYAVNGSVPSGTMVTTDLSMLLQYTIPSTSEATLRKAVRIVTDEEVREKYSAVFLQVVAHASDHSIIGGSRVKVLSSIPRFAPSDLANLCGFVPDFTNGEDIYEPQAVTEENLTKVGGMLNWYEYDMELGFHIEAQNVAYYSVRSSAYSVEMVDGLGIQATNVTATGAVPTLYNSNNDALVPGGARVLEGTRENSITYTRSKSLRSGARITKSMLLSSSATPADYLLSFCKMFGLRLLYDNATREVTILERQDLYEDKVTDISGMVDTSHPIEVTPLAYDAKWYEFKLQGVGGAFFDEYKSSQGMEYGIKRVNTGYDFNAETKNLMEGNVFKNGVTTLARSRHFTIPFLSGAFIPSVFLDQGNTFTLWDSMGESLDTAITEPLESVDLEFYNEYDHPYYDAELARKMEFRNAENKPIDGAGVLVFWEGYQRYPYFNLSDDVPAMDLLNDGVPCWLLTPGDPMGVNIPVFQRHLFGAFFIVDRSLDFGVPKELDIPGIRYPETATIYSRYWRRYLVDRYDVNTKVMRCKVHFKGLQVGQDLLRRFYWFENSLWVLNSIKNHSLTTYDPVECEFVQVQDKNNYLNIDE